MQDLAFQNSLSTQRRDVTLLFADLRGFTSISASLEIDLTSELLGQVMDCLTAAVIDQDGTVLDYYGDGLAAMWNAPADQPRHSDLACHAALQMLKTLPAIAADWSAVIQADLRLGIGVHTGMVQVGNAGSAQRTKYGPRGPNVHVASRVEAATKELALPLVVTQSTAERLSDRFAPQRICRARVPGLHQPIDLYAILTSAADERVSSMWRAYAEALRQFEQGRLNEAADLLATIDPAAGDVPSRLLAEHVERELGRQQRRRRTDRTIDSSGGVITLNAK